MIFLGERQRQKMESETPYRLAFLALLVALFAMRVYFMLKVRRAGERLLPD